MEAFDVGARHRRRRRKHHRREAIRDEGGLRDVGAVDDNLGEVRGLIDPARGFAGEVVGLAVEDAEAGPDDGRIGELVGDTQARREVVQVLLAAAVAAILGALERLIARIARCHAVELGEEAADSEPAHRDAVRESTASGTAPSARPTFRVNRELIFQSS